jgi:hypothetical protein
LELLKTAKKQGGSEMFGMQVEKAKEEKQKITVTTTGAEFIFNKKSREGEIILCQRLGKRRVLAKITISLPLKDLTLEVKDREKVILHQTSLTSAFLKMRISAGSLLTIYSTSLIENLTCLGNFKPEYTASEGGNFLIIDNHGGIGLYPDLTSWPDKVTSTFSGNSWKIIYPFKFQKEIMISVFPPRPFNEKQSFKENIVHHVKYSRPYPSDEEITRWSKHCKVFALHEEIWKGKLARRGIKFDPNNKEDMYRDCSWQNYHYLPRDERELLRVIDTAHKLKMKIVPYFSPFYSLAEGEEYLARMKDILDKYGFDGVYFDELLVQNNIKQAYKVIRDTRKLLGNRILYMHCTGSSRYMYCPFIDTYADYIMRGEHFYPFDEHYLRYVLSGFNISNSIGYVCAAGDYPLTFRKKLINHCLAANVRLPYFVPGTKEYQKMMEEGYFPKLKRVASGEKIKPSELEPLMNKEERITDKSAE